MLRGALKHFTVVGIAFAIVGGVVVATTINTVFSVAFRAATGFPPTRYFASTLVLTVVIIGSITMATLWGNRRFLGWFGLSGLSARSVAISTGLFTILVWGYTFREVRVIAENFGGGSRFYSAHPGEAVAVGSLPMLRAILIPLGYLLVSRAVLFKVTPVSDGTLHGGGV